MNSATKYCARDVLKTDILTVPPQLTVADTIACLLQNHISGAPVVDSEGQLLGVISEYQLLEVVFTPELLGRPVEQFMTRDVVTVSEDTLLTEIATRFVLHRIRRLPVVRDGRMVGMISRRDVLAKILPSAANARHELAELVAL